MYFSAVQDHTIAARLAINFTEKEPWLVDCLRFAFVGFILRFVNSDDLLTQG